MCAFQQCFAHRLLSRSFTDSQKATVTCINLSPHDSSSVKDTFISHRVLFIEQREEPLLFVVLGTNENVSAVSSTGEVDISPSLNVEFSIEADLFALFAALRAAGGGNAIK